MLTVLICSLIAMACVAGNSHGPSSEDRSRSRNVTGRADTIVVARDAYLGPDGDDYWKGTTDSLVVDGVRSTRILIQVNQAAIETAIGSGTLANATLELTVQTAGAAWPAGGATVDAHRVLQHWTEAEVTWVCADGHEGWDMSTGAGSIWQIAHTARTTITNGQTGVVRLDVTADVAAFLSGQANHGWLIKRTSEGATEPGRISFSSREGAPQPRLIIQVASDTARPTLPDTFAFPTPTTTVARPGSPAGVLYYRDIVGIRFDDTTSGTTVRAVLAEYDASIIGGLPWVDEFVVRIPDPGPTWSAYDSVLTQMEQEQGVDYVAGVTSQSAFRIKHRHPGDGPGLLRSDWLSPTAGSPARPLFTIRAPLAWGCETGDYAATLARVGVLDLQFDTQHPDLAANSPVSVQPPVGDLNPAVTLLPDEIDHGTAVAGVMTARGDNGTAGIGVLWRSDLRLFALARNSQLVHDPTVFAATVLFPAAATTGVRVLVNSVDFGDTHARSQARLRVALRRYIRFGQGNLFVMAADEGVSPRRNTIANAILGPGSTSLGLERAFVELFAGSDRARLLIVSASDNSDQLASFSDHYPDATELVAPGVDILTLTAGGGTAFVDGTSYAAPFVAGAAGLLVAAEPGPRGEELKDYLVRGAAEPRVDPSTGAMVPAPSIGVSGGRLLDLYGALMLRARERLGTPLCGNRIWVENGMTVRVERANGVETIATLASPITSIYTYHGGRIAQYSGGYLRHAGGTWTSEVGVPPSQAIVGGSFLSSLSWTHDRDSIVDPQWGRTIVSSGSVPVSLLSYTTFAGRLVTNIPVVLGTNEKAYVSSSPSPASGFILVSVSILGTDGPPEYSKRAIIYRLPWLGGSPTQLVEIPDRTVAWLGISEDGSEFAVATGRKVATPGSPIENCEISFRSIATGSAVRTVPVIYACSDESTISGGFAPLRASRSKLQR